MCRWAMKNKLKKHIVLIILLAIALVFPTSLSYQARLNMRVIVTGLAIDKTGDEYMLTAQIVKTSPGNESPGQSAMIDFVTDKAKNLSEAVSKLAYKAGKVSAFSHTNFLVLGDSLLKEDVTKCLDYFIRDKVIKNSALVLFSGGSAEEEIKKTKDTELSVGIGLQKVFLFKENEGDGLMVTLIDFLNQNKMYSCTSFASELSMHTNNEAKQEDDKSKSESSSESEGSSDSSSGEGSGSGESYSGGSGGTSSGGGNSSSKAESQQYFDPETPIVCFVGGKFVGKLKKEEDIDGFMLAKNLSQKANVNVQDVKEGRLKGLPIEVAIKKKKVMSKINYENGKPILELKIIITKSEIVEIMEEEIIAGLTDEEFNAVKKGLEKQISSEIKGCFQTTKNFGADVFNAYEKAYKWKYKETTSLFSDAEEFLKDLGIKIKVEIKQLDY